MQERHTNRRLYFDELANTSREFYVDYLKRFKPLTTGMRILEIGCGEGGNLLPFAEKGCQVYGMDLNREKIECGKRFFAEQGHSVSLLCQNFMNYTLADTANDTFDIVLVHDVIEHIEPDMKTAFMQRVKYFMKPDGIAFFAFPAWQMPFGGHQQICKSRISKIPYLHLLPEQLYKRVLNDAHENQSTIEDLINIRHSKMPVERFERLYKATDFKLLHRQLWFINPHYKQKFHLKPRKQSILMAHIPWLRNFVTTACFYLLQK